MRMKVYFLGRQMGKTCLQVAEEAQKLRLIEEPITVVVDEFPQKPQLDKVAEVLKKLKRSNTEEEFHLSIKNRKKYKGQEYGKSKYF